MPSPEGGARRETRPLHRKGRPRGALRWRDANSDAGTYLLGRARWEGRIGDLLEHVDEVHAAIERSGAWEESHEWRIGTVSTDRIEREEGRYRVSTSCDGVYAATVSSFPVALEAIRVLGAVQKDLFYDLGWASWVGRRQMRPTDPAPKSADEDDVREVYLERLSEQAIADYEPLLAEISERLVAGRAWGRTADESGADINTTIRSASVDWSGDVVYEVAVDGDGLSMTCISPTIARAAQFAGAFEALEADIIRLLGWR